MIVVGGTAVRSYGIADCSIWLDEAASWRAIQFPWREMFTRVGGDNHVPLYFVLLKLWAGVFGESLEAMRGLSVVFGGVTCVAVYLFAQEAFAAQDGQSDRTAGEDGKWIGLLAAALVAVSLPQIKAAGQVRMYTLGTALTAISSWTLFRALHSRGRSWRPWAAHTLANLALAYTHHFGMFAIAGQVIFLAGHFLVDAKWRLAPLFQNRSCRCALASYGLVVAGWGLSLPILFQQIRQVERQWWSPPLTLESMLRQIRELLLGNSSFPLTNESLLIAAAVFAAVILALACKSGAGPRYTLCLVLFPIIASLIISLNGSNLFLARYLIFSQTMLLAGIAVLLASLRIRWMRYAAASVLVGGGVTIDADYRAALDLPHRPGVRGAVACIEAQRRADDEVVVATPVFYLSTSYYFDDQAHCRLIGNRPVPHNCGASLLKEDDFISVAQINRLGPGRVWVISEAKGDSIRIPADWRTRQEVVIGDPPGRFGDIRVEEYEILEGEKKP